MIFQVFRIIAVVALLGVAAAILTPPGRLPLALRGLNNLLGRPVAHPEGASVSPLRRALAFLLVLLALALIVLF